MEKCFRSLSSDGKIASQIAGKSSFKGEGIQESINHCVLLLLSNLYRLEVSEGGIYLGMKQSELIILELPSFDSQECVKTDVNKVLSWDLFV